MQALLFEAKLIAEWRLPVTADERKCGEWLKKPALPGYASLRNRINKSKLYK